MKDLWVLDFETYYSSKYSLSKLTTEEYIRHPDFEVIGLAMKRNDEPAYWVDGPDVSAALSKIDWSEAGVIAHNTLFDGAILSWLYGVRPKMWFDTLCMARAIRGVEKSASLKALADAYGIGVKGDEVVKAMGKRRADFTPWELASYGGYACNDAELCARLFRILIVGFPRAELQLIDMTLRMFTQPTFELDLPLLQRHLEKVRLIKADLLASSGTTKEELMSNPKFAEALRALGVEPPMKVSPTTGKLTFAFAKSDEDFKALQEHEDIRVQAIVAARIGAKSTLEETRTERFIGIGERGSFPIPLKYYAAHTGRWGGSDSVNLQNLPSRGPEAKALKRAIKVAAGYKLIEADSSQIEARTLAWWSGQDDLVEAFARNEDVYKRMATRIYSVPEVEVSKERRHVGKTTVLGSGFGMGGDKFQIALKNSFPSVSVPLDEAKRIIAAYRAANPKIVALWRQAQVMLEHLARGDAISLGRPGVVEVVPELSGIRLPSGLILKYEGLRATQGERGVQYVYDTRKGPTYIYGGKVVENIVQALARCIVAEQMLRISKRHRVILTVHDSCVVCARDDEVEAVQAYVEECMRWTPEWAAGLPVNCESGVGENYGDC